MARVVTVDMEDLERVRRELPPQVAEAMEAIRAGHRRNVRSVLAKVAGEAVLLLAVGVLAFVATEAVMHKAKGCDGGAFVCSKR